MNRPYEAVEKLHLPAAAPLARSLRYEILAESPIRLRFRALISAKIRAPRLRGSISTAPYAFEDCYNSLQQRHR